MNNVERDGSLYQSPEELPADLQKEIVAARDIVEKHANELGHALEALQQFARGKISMRQFKDLKEALAGATKARASIEKAKRLIKARLQDELKE